MAEQFGVQGRGSFYEETGAIRDVVQNHLLQVTAILAMDAPVGQRRRGHPRREGARPQGDRAARSGARRARPVPRLPRRARRRADSTVETFAAVRAAHRHLALGGRAVLHPRRQVPAGHRDRGAGRAQDAAARRLRRARAARPNYLRFRLGPDVAIALGVRVKRPGEAMVGRGDRAPRLGGSRGRDAALRAAPRRRDARRRAPVRAPGRGRGSSGAWSTRCSATTTPLYPYEPGTWGPAEAERLVPGSGVAGTTPHADRGGQP